MRTDRVKELGLQWGVRAAAAAGVAALLLAGAGCGGGNGGGHPQGMSMPVVYEEAVIESLDETLILVGTLVGDEEVDISFNRSGRVVEIQFEEGDSVGKGEVLAVLDTRVLNAMLRQAEAAHALAEADFRRGERLYEQRTISEQELDQLRAAFETAEANLNRVREELADATLTAPFSGVLGRRHVSPGRYVSAGDPLTRLVVLDPLKVEFSVPERYFSRLQIGWRVGLHVAAWPGVGFEGTIDFIGPEVDARTRTIPVNARVDNADGRLRPGMFARVELQTTGLGERLMISEAALMVRGKEEFIFIIGADDLVEVRVVETGLRHEGRIEIVSGLDAGERVIIEGIQKVGPGSKVAPSRMPARGQKSEQTGTADAGNRSGGADGQ